MTNCLKRHGDPINAGVLVNWPVVVGYVNDVWKANGDQYIRCQLDSEDTLFSPQTNVPANSRV